MRKTLLEKYRKELLQLKSQILNSGMLTSNDDLHVPSDDLPDEADLATNVINQQVSFKIRARELAKLREIELALERINDKSYGRCLECEEEIAAKRLSNQPWASLCIVHAEEREREGQQYARMG